MGWLRGLSICVARWAEMIYAHIATMTMIAEYTAEHHIDVVRVSFESGQSAHYEGLATGAADCERAVR